MESNNYRVRPPWAIDDSNQPRTTNYPSRRTLLTNSRHVNNVNTYPANPRDNIPINVAPGGRGGDPMNNGSRAGHHSRPMPGVVNPTNTRVAYGNRSVPVNEASHAKPPRSFRYGGRRHVKPYDRDLEYWNNFRPYSAPYGTNSHRERERARREGRLFDERRMLYEAEERSLVPLEKLLSRDILSVVSVNFHIGDNCRAHKTQDYECTERAADPRLVVRRGNVFFMTFTFQRPWSKKEDDLTLDFIVGEEPRQEDGTLESFRLNDLNSPGYRPEGRWGVRIAKAEGPKLTLAIYIDADAIVGEWGCHLSTTVYNNEERKGNEVFIFTGIPEIYVLFNPWCPEDLVHYTENPADLNEYILNEYGCVFNGMADYIGKKSWYYGQFQYGILNTCMTLLRLAFDLDVNKDMSDPVMVARKLSRIINSSHKDPGLLVGNWSGDYSDGTSPSKWHGSVEILEQYARTKNAVKYGQCWVFSQVLTTVCRALGIPCRSLTNYESAHDTDKTATIDSYKDENGEDLPDYKSDSVWNFHCWNDVWINRPDLDTTSSSRGRYSGWHALDATPQERSAGMYQCGPSPHLAIRSGEISIGHDTGFIFAEVNGEVCTWAVPWRGTRDDLKLISRDPHAIGKSISTKIPDGKPSRGTYNPGARQVHEARLDVTHLYKHSEGSPEERAALKLAVGKGLGAKIFETPGGVSVDIAKPTSVMAGNDFMFSATFTNSDRKMRILKTVTLGVFPIDYRGERRGWDKVAYSKVEGVSLQPGQSHKFDLPVSERMYLKLCDNSLSMNLRASASIEGEDKPVTKMVKIVMAVPPLKVEIPGTATRIRRGYPFTVVLVVTNPLKRPLSGCVLELSGPVFPVESQGFTERDGTYTKAIKDIFPNQTTVLNLEVQAASQPLHNNTRQMEVTLVSKQLPEMDGELTFSVQ